MIVSNCPRCDEAFRVPSGEWPEDAYVQCPWCEETLPISEVLQRLPPILKVLSADGHELHPAQQPAAHALLGAGTVVDAPDGADLSVLSDFGEPDEADRLSAKTVSDETVSDETVTDETWSDGSLQVDDVLDDVIDEVIDEEFIVRDPNEGSVDELSSGGAAARR